MISHPVLRCLPFTCERALRLVTARSDRQSRVNSRLRCPAGPDLHSASSRLGHAEWHTSPRKVGPDPAALQPIPQPAERRKHTDLREQRRAASNHTWLSSLAQQPCAGCSTTHTVFHLVQSADNVIHCWRLPSFWPSSRLRKPCIKPSAVTPILKKSHGFSAFGSNPKLYRSANRSGGELC
jgi:hypothetical protein